MGEELNIIKLYTSLHIHKPIVTFSVFYILFILRQLKTCLAFSFFPSFFVSRNISFDQKKL